MPQDFDLEQTQRNLAHNLRRLRSVRELTQARLAELSGIPRSTIANLEADGGNPTLAILGRLASALQISIEELLSTPHAMCRVFRNGSLPVEQRGPHEKVTVHRLLPDPMSGMEIDRFVLAPGGRMKGVPHQAGTREYLYCERGKITLWAAGERYDLGAGDLATFHGDQRHAYANAGRSQAVAFSVVAFASIKES